MLQIYSSLTCSRGTSVCFKSVSGRHFVVEQVRASDWCQPAGVVVEQVYALGWCQPAGVVVEQV